MAFVASWDSGEFVVRRGAPPLRGVPRTRAALRGLEAGLEGEDHEHGGVPTPETRPQAQGLYTPGNHGEHGRPCARTL